VALLVAARVAERRAVEEVLGGHRLPAVDAGIELAAAEHRVAVRLHRQIARLHVQHRFGEADVGAGDERQILVVLLVHRVRDVRRGHVDARAGGDLHGLLEAAHLHADVVADLLAAAEQDAAALRRA
jgi:head-tail adaptor